MALNLMKICQLLHYALQCMQLALDGGQDVLDFCVPPWDPPVDGVPGHALPMIGRYPRGGASGSLMGFRLAPITPSGAKVLRAGLAVIARRAYGSIVHGSW